MAFAYTIISKNGETTDDVPEREGRKKVIFGTFTNGVADTGGDIVTGLDEVEDFTIQHTGSAVVDDEPVINETMPLVTTGTVTIVTTAGADGIWKAVGR